MTPSAEAGVAATSERPMANISVTTLAVTFFNVFFIGFSWSGNRVVRNGVGLPRQGSARSGKRNTTEAAVTGLGADGRKRSGKCDRVPPSTRIQSVGSGEWFGTTHPRYRKRSMYPLIGTNCFCLSLWG